MKRLGTVSTTVTKAISSSQVFMIAVLKEYFFSKFRHSKKSGK
jgi:hypothetical protein